MTKICCNISSFIIYTTYILASNIADVENIQYAEPLADEDYQKMSNVFHDFNDGAKELYDFLEDYDFNLLEHSTNNDLEEFLTNLCNDVADTHTNQETCESSLRCIEMQSDILMKEANTILRKCKSVPVKKRIENKVKNTKNFFDQLKDIQNLDTLQNNVDYTSLDQKIINLFFETQYIDGKRQNILVFSESKFSNFISKKNLVVFDMLYIYKKYPNYKMLSIIEFHSIQKFYDYFPELIVLESICYASEIHRCPMLCYLRSLRLILNYYNENLDAITEIREKINKFVEKILITETCIRDCSYSNSNVMTKNLGSCGKKHEKNLLNIFKYMVDCEIRKRFKRQNLPIRKGSSTFENIMFTGFYIVSNRLLLNKYLGDEKTDTTKINNFIDLIKSSCNCVYCVMDECLSILRLKN